MTKKVLVINGNPKSESFGALVQGESRDTVFTAKSAGDEPLVISSVTKSCGCTRADIMLVQQDGSRKPYVLNTPIPVGQEFEIHAEIDTTGKQNLFRTDITLMTNDPRKGVVFSLEVDVKAPLLANPRSLNLAQLKATETKQGQVLITTELDQPFGLRIDENIPLKNCEVELVPTAPNACNCCFRATMNLIGENRCNCRLANPFTLLVENKD